MSKANELRIGNLVTDQRGFIGSVTQICEDQTIKVRNKDGVLLGWMRADLFHQIPVTEEILLKCGFEKKFPFYVKGNIEVRIMGNSMPCWVSSRFVTTKDKHLHQLQHLYFALTGEELNIEL